MRPLRLAFLASLLGLIALLPSVGWALSPPDLPAALRPSAGGSDIILLEFSATWCKSCKVIHPFVQSYTQSNKGQLGYIPLDIDQPEVEPYLDQFDVVSVPSYVIYNKQGKVLWSTEDDVTKAQLKKKLDTCLANKQC
jgi:thiol:disulfide interchange protein